MTPLRYSPLFLAALCLPAVPASAELPEGVKAMIEAAIATGDAKKVETVLELARATNPDETVALDAIATEWKAAQAARAAEEKAAKEEKIRTAGLFDLWSGEGEIGGFRTTGNTDSIGVVTSLKLQRNGLKWRHLLRARADYQRQNGQTSREQFNAAYEPHWQFGKDAFVYGLAQFERDRRQGFEARYAVSGGLGYKVFDKNGMKLSLKAGPAWRITEFNDGSSKSRLAGLFGTDFDWEIAKGVTVSQDVSALAEGGGEVQVLVDGSNTSVNLVTGLDVKITEKLRSRLSYAIEYDSNPPAGAVQTDSLTRFTFIFGF